MKTIYTLSALFMITLSLNTFADDKVKNNERYNSAASVAPFTWGTPGTEIPAELRSLKAKNALVPVAPFVWGDPDASLSVKGNLLVPVAPFIYGDPELDIPARLKFIKAVNADVPVAPFILGDSRENKLEIIEILK